MAPVGNLAGEDLLQLLDGEIVNSNVLIDDRAHTDNANFVVGDLLEVSRILDLRFSKDIGVTNLNSSLSDLRDALTGSAALDGDLDTRILLHELLGSSLT